jgi:cell division protease FtsH
MNRTFKTAVFWAVIVLSAWLFWQTVRSKPANTRPPEIDYSTFIAEAEAGKIARVSVTGTQIEGDYRDGKGTFRLTGPNNPAVYLGILQDMGVQIRFRDVPTENSPFQMLGNWAPLILVGALWFLMVRQMRRRSPPNATGSSVDASGGLR